VQVVGGENSRKGFQFFCWFAQYLEILFVGCSAAVFVDSTLQVTWSLPLYLTRHSRKKYASNQSFASGILPHLMRLITALDRLNVEVIPLEVASSSGLVSPADADRRYLRRLTAKKDRRTFIETKHPYPQGKNQLKQTLVITGAEALCLHFDTRSRTAGSSDVLQLFKSSSMNDPLTNSKDGKQLVFSGDSFPRQSITVQGDSITFVFSANSRVDPNALRSADKTSRWGFRCRITEITSAERYEEVFASWLLDLENSLALVSGKYAATLVEGDAVGDMERRCAPWLEAKLLNGGLQSGRSDYFNALTVFRK
jgi:hypothetical protein